MQTEQNGFQTEALATLTIRRDLDTIAKNASGLVLGGVGILAHGLAYLAGEAPWGEPVTRELVIARLFVQDATRRRERAEALRRLADVLEANQPPTAEDLEGILPDRWADAIALGSLESTMRARVASIPIDRADRSAWAATLRRVPVDRLARLLRSVKHAAITVFGLSQPGDKRTCN